MTSEGQDGRQRPTQQGSDDVAGDVDLGACLEAAGDLQDEASQHMYKDADVSPSWVEDVIEMTSAREVTSPSDHLEAAFGSEDVASSQGQMLSRPPRADFVGRFHFTTSTDTSTFFPLQTTLSVQEPQHRSSLAVSQSMNPPLDSRHTVPSSSSLASSSSSSSDPNFLGQLDIGENPGPSQSSSDSCNISQQSVFSFQASTSDPSNEAVGNRGARLKSLLKSKLHSRRCHTTTSLSDAERPQPMSQSVRSEIPGPSQSCSEGSSTSRQNVVRCQTSTSSDPTERGSGNQGAKMKSLLKSKLHSKRGHTSVSHGDAERLHLWPDSSETPGPSQSTPDRPSTSRQTVFGCQASTSSDPTEGGSGNQGAKMKSLLKSKLHSKSGLASTSQDDAERLQPWPHSLSSVARSISISSNDSTSQDSDATGTLTHSLSTSSSSLAAQSVEEEGDEEKLLEKREKNRLAAQKSRDKKRKRREKLEQVVSRLECRQERLQEEVQTLREEKETLEDILHVHSLVCPNLPKPPGDPPS